MPTFLAAPTFLRVGVIAGFILDAGTGLVPTITKGVLFAQSTMYRPVVAPTLPAATASQQSWLWWSSTDGFYWTSTFAPTVADDAGLGWVRCNGTQVVAWSVRRLGSGDEAKIVPAGPVTISVGDADGDTDVAGMPFFGVQGGPGYGLAGQLGLGGISFATLDNTASVRSGTFALYYIDELAPPTVTLAAAMTTGATSFTASGAIAGASAGDFVVIGWEIIQLVIADGSSITRAQKDSLAQAHAIGDKIWLVKAAPQVVYFPPNFFDSILYQGLLDVEPFRAKRLVAAELFVTNGVGNSAPRTEWFGHNDDNGLRVLSGWQIDLTVEGVLAIGSDQAIPQTLPQAASVRDIFATVQLPPIGASITADLKVNGVVLATVTVAPGASPNVPTGVLDMTTTPSVDGMLIPADGVVTLDVTAVGTTFPGSRLTVTVRM